MVTLQGKLFYQTEKGVRCFSQMKSNISNVGRRCHYSGEVSKEDIVALVNEKTSIADSSSLWRKNKTNHGLQLQMQNVLNNSFATENIDRHVCGPV
ncbi:hypothetical protein AVEN_56661-1 [Araneus ventricosus]|uniref:Uncharacterized protein n=1 Tax=Araneus ventricosus TaxID=182803 RepID=A0A4Y2HZZ4_ARAVE|nr:hypothetical protein AVEN_56661-1 [Araneus ventricosus]